ncbi:molecular chaperone [Mixta tenebrionis]|uniref:Fimbria/pilus periplasmic chaperone n=1 Tax=Mixta tenebrionis TaxID=2562439 RepID=A0A506VD29_9GAMM|nr:fimbria/pilus periplasmic chaperone [Mixta tenebrionis]TPW43647.1 fimbria/pilus periplasmic chaperone [Mixta tenebrionis]
MYKWIFSFLLLLSLVSSEASAGVVIGGTRIIFHGDRKEATISVNNTDATSWLVQSWTESLDGGKAPFIFSPPLFRLDGQQKNVLRLLFTGGNLPEDRESLFWANIKSIPGATDDENILQIAIKNQLKLIYRPTAIKKALKPDIYEKLQWSQQQGRLQVNNPTPFYMNFHSVVVNGKAVNYPEWVAPFASKTYDIPQLAASGKVSWRVINDFGAPTATFEAAY